MNEAKWQCVNCARFHSELAEEPIVPGDPIQCKYCKNDMIVEQITYFLHVREPDPE